MQQNTGGFALLLIAGAMNGSFTLPMKFTRKWAWENTWLVWTIFALGIFPIFLTLVTVPSLRAIYEQSGISPVLLAAGCGAAWGVSQIFLGLAVEGIGMALAFSMILGISAALGSLVPLLRLHPQAVLQKGGLTLLFGVALTLTGVGIAAIAGRLRERALQAGDLPAVAKLSATKGLLFATISGVGSAVVNIGFAFAEPLPRAAHAFGVRQIWWSNTIWLPLMLAGGIPNLLYCIYLMRTNRTAGRLRLPGTAWYWLMAFVMALFWFGSTVMYGVGATALGTLGPILGWPVFMSLIVITATLWGIFMGEWKQAGKKPLQIMTCGVAVLVAAIFVLGISSRMF